MRNYLMNPKVAQIKVAADQRANQEIVELISAKKEKAGVEIAQKRDDMFSEMMTTVTGSSCREELIAKRDQFEEDLKVASEEILKRIKEETEQEMAQIRHKHLAHWLKMLEEGYGEVKERYPTIWGSLIDNPADFSLDRLREMLLMKDLISTGSITHEVASEQIGQRYFDEFVKPVVGDKE